MRLSVSETGREARCAQVLLERGFELELQPLRVRLQGGGLLLAGCELGHLRCQVSAEGIDLGRRLLIRLRSP